MENEKVSKKSSFLARLGLLLSIVVFLYAGLQLYEIFSAYGEGEREYDEIREEVTKEIAEDNEKNAVPFDGDIAGDDGEKKEKVSAEDTVFSVDFARLAAINPDVVGWLRFEEPSRISYPVVQGGDNQEYLNKTFEGKKNGAGAIFMDAFHQADFSDSNTFLYGHNMKNGSMFGTLRKYKSGSFGNAHPYFSVFTPDGRELVYEVFAVSVVSDTSESYRKLFSGGEDFLEYVSYIKSVSLYTRDVEVDGSSRLVSLSTCTNVREEERLLVHGVLVNEVW